MIKLKDVPKDRPTSRCLLFQRIKDAYDNVIEYDNIIEFHDDNKVFLYAVDDVILFSNTQIRGRKKKATGFEILKGEEICHIEERYASKEDENAAFPIIIKLYGERGVYNIMETSDDDIYCSKDPRVLTVDVIATRLSGPSGSITNVRVADDGRSSENLDKVKKHLDQLSEKTKE